MWEPRMRVGRKLKDTHAGALYTGHTPPTNGNHAVTHSHAHASSHTRSCRVAVILPCGSLWQPFLAQDPTTAPFHRVIQGSSLSFHSFSHRPCHSTPDTTHHLLSRTIRPSLTKHITYISDKIQFQERKCVRMAVRRAICVIPGTPLPPNQYPLSLHPSHLQARITQRKIRT